MHAYLRQAGWSEYFTTCWSAGILPFQQDFQIKKRVPVKVWLWIKRINPCVKSSLVSRFLQNAAARVLSGAQTSQHITAILICPRWTAIKTAAQWTYVSFHFRQLYVTGDTWDVFSTVHSLTRSLALHYFVLTTQQQEGRWDDRNFVSAVGEEIILWSSWDELNITSDTLATLSINDWDISGVEVWFHLPWLRVATVLWFTLEWSDCMIQFLCVLLLWQNNQKLCSRMQGALFDHGALWVFYSTLYSGWN